MSTSPVLPCLRITGIPPEQSIQEELLDIVEFCHPGYEYPHDVLFRLPALDKCDGKAGVHHETARLACCILAGNAWEGWLTANEPGGPRIDINHDTEAMLTESRYFFHRPHDPASTDQSHTTQYPIVRDFESWLFPRGNLPPYWHALAIPAVSASAQKPPRRCAVSSRFLPLENAYLIPLSQSTWFDKNMMGLYQRTTDASRTRWINQPPNSLPLTKDIHCLLDQTEHLTFAPRRVPADAAQTVGIQTYAPRDDSSESQSVDLICHVLRPSPANEIGQIYHLRSLEPLQGILPEYLFANFALKICNLCIFFQDDGVRRYCFELNVDETDGSMSHTVQIATFHKPEFQKPSRSPTMRRDSSQASSNKRARSVQDEDEGDGSKRSPRWFGTGGDVHDYAQDSYWVDSAEDGDQAATAHSHGIAERTILDGSPEHRGRSLKRSIAETTWTPVSPDLDHVHGDQSCGSWVVMDKPCTLIFDDGEGVMDSRERPRLSPPRKKRRRLMLTALSEVG
ncbi:hypothetical protein VM1G_06438 [Cytospora mali]|uniref:HNH nuclease domain-containing protein n=1 Tax=Cytospora mali TaxID=578113 RepID=A0A194W4C6_CYTMA|nr:hypothetical protein VM1G_06438 [Valsa mali]